MTPKIERVAVKRGPLVLLGIGGHRRHPVFRGQPARFFNFYYLRNVFGAYAMGLRRVYWRCCRSQS